MFVFRVVSVVRDCVSISQQTDTVLLTGLLLNVKQLADQLWRYDPAHETSPADAKRRTAPGGTEADLRVRLSKPAGSAINVIEEQS